MISSHTLHRRIVPLAVHVHQPCTTTGSRYGFAVPSPYSNPTRTASQSCGSSFASVHRLPLPRGYSSGIASHAHALYPLARQALKSLPAGSSSAGGRPAYASALASCAAMRSPHICFTSSFSFDLASSSTCSCPSAHAISHRSVGMTRRARSACAAVRGLCCTSLEHVHSPI